MSEKDMRAWANYQLAEKLQRLDQLDELHQRLTEILLGAGFFPTAMRPGAR